MSSQISGKSFDTNDLFVALADGDAQTAAAVLRQLDGLGSGELELLADLLDGEPPIEKSFPFKLVLKRWKPGKPADHLAKHTRLFTLGLMIDRAQKSDPKHEKLKLSAAIADVSKKTGHKTTILKKAWKLYSRIIRKPSKVAKTPEYGEPDKA